MQDLASSLRHKSILITGGTGFFGKNLCSALAHMNGAQNLGMKIYALARTPFSLEGVQFIEQDVTRPFRFEETADFVIHAATPVVKDDQHFHQMMEVIVNGTQNVLEYAHRSKSSKVLLVSSGAVYGEQPEEIKNIPEDFVAQGPFYNAQSAYSTGKRMSELMALDWSKRTGVPLSIARCFAFSGPHLPLDQHLAIGNFVRDALTTKTIQVKGDGSPIRTYMDADDLVAWLLTILIRGGSGEVYNVGSDREISMKELARKVAEKIPGVQVVIQNAESALKRNRYVPSVEKARRDLHLEARVSLDESIQKMIDTNKRIV